MQKFLNSVRSRSDEEKKVIAFSVAIILTIIIAIIWIALFFISPKDSEVVEETVHDNQVASPLESIKEQFQSLQKEFQGAKGSLEEGVKDLRQLEN